MMEVHGTCRHCGQYVLVRVNEDATQEEINEAATLECGCSESKKDKEKQEKIRKCKSTIKEIFGDTRVAELLTEAADDIREGTMMQMTLKLTKSTTAKVWINADGEISVEKKTVKKESTKA